jgi:hypothetical protein
VPDWRWVTQVQSPGSLHGSVLKPSLVGQWIDIDGVDSIMPYDAPYHPAKTRLGWMTNSGWHYLFVAEQIVPVIPDEANNNPQEGESNAHNALESTQVR